MVSKIAKVLTMYRITPQSTIGTSPAELLQGRCIRTKLDLLVPNINGRVERQQLKQKLNHDRPCRFTQFVKGETVYAQKFGTGQRWMPAVIQEVTGPVSFLVKLTDGQLIRRHQDHLRKRAPDEGHDENPVPDISVDVSPSIGDTTLTPGHLPAGVECSATDTGESAPEVMLSLESLIEQVPETRQPNTSVPLKVYPKRQRKQPDWYHGNP